MAAYCEIPVTHAHRASAVALVTGHERRDKDRPAIDYTALASFPGTLVFYMSVSSVAEWSGALLAGGKSPDTPVAIVRRCSWADQQTFRCTLLDRGRRGSARPLAAPVVFVVGEVVGEAPETSWFAARPLFGVRVLVTRPSEQVADLRDRFGGAGGRGVGATGHRDWPAA